MKNMISTLIQKFTIYKMCTHAYDILLLFLYVSFIYILRFSHKALQVKRIHTRMQSEARIGLFNVFD